jgi:thioredoxin
MNKQEFSDKLEKNPLPVVVDLWAPWCGPCKMVKPILEKLSGEYAGRVDLWQINADENQELVRELKVYGIPTLIVFRDGKEILRQVGAKPASALKELFESLSQGATPTPSGLAINERLIRMGAGIAVTVLAVSSGWSWFLLVLGGALMFSAVYDRCPIWRALTGQFKKMTGRA